MPAAGWPGLGFDFGAAFWAILPAYIFVTLAFLPKITALLLVIPDPVIGAYAMVIIAVLFVLGTRIVLQDGMDYRKATIVGVSFWVGVGFQSGEISTAGLSPFLQQMLDNGMTSGGLTALVLTAFMELSGPRRVRMQTTLEVQSLPKIQQFLENFAGRKGLGGETALRLAHAAEETLLLLIEQGTDDETAAPRRLRLTARAGVAVPRWSFWPLAAKATSKTTWP